MLQEHLHSTLVSPSQIRIGRSVFRSTCWFSRRVLVVVNARHQQMLLSHGTTLTKGSFTLTADSDPMVYQVLMSMNLIDLIYPWYTSAYVCTGWFRQKCLTPSNSSSGINRILAPVVYCSWLTCFGNCPPLGSSTVNKLLIQPWISH